MPVGRDKVVEGAGVVTSEPERVACERGNTKSHRNRKRKKEDCSYELHSCETMLHYKRIIFTVFILHQNCEENVHNFEISELEV